MAVITAKPYLNFEIIPSNDCRIMMVADLSQYAHLENEPVVISVTLPGYTNPVDLPFEKGKLNILNAGNLGLSDAESADELPNLPDGIYKITLKTCPYDILNVTKDHLQNCQQLCDFKNKLIAVDLLCHCDENAAKAKAKLHDIILLIEASKAHAARCNVKRAMEHYRKADDLLKQLADLCIN